MARLLVLDEGKYTVVIPEVNRDGQFDTNLHALRYGEAWQDLSGNNLVHSMAIELYESRELIHRLRGRIADLEKTDTEKLDA